LIKVLAVVLMIIDHIGKYFFPEILWLRVLGRGAAPLFFFLIGYQGKVHLSAPLYIYGLILTATTWYCTHKLFFNILLNFILVHFILQGLKQRQMSVWFLVGFFLMTTLLNPVFSLHLEYGSIGWLIAISVYLLHAQYPKAHLFLLYSLFVYFLWEGIFLEYLEKNAIMTGFAVLMGAIYIIMVNFSIKTLPYSGKLKWPFMFLSRYSLEIYFVHLLLFKLSYYVFFNT